MRMEKAAEIIFIHSDYFGERRELYLLRKMRFDILKDLLEHIYLIKRTRRAVGIFGIVFVFENVSE